MSMARIAQTSAIIFGAKSVMRMRTYTLKRDLGLTPSI